MLKKTLVIVALALFVVACNKGGSETTTPELSPMEELKAVATNLDAKVQCVVQPINEVDTVVAEIQALPGKLNIDSAKLMSMAKLTVDGTQVEIEADLTIDEAARAEIAAVLAKLKVIADDLKATPDKINELNQATVEAVASLPVLATKVTSAAQLKLTNPMASAEVKAAAQAEIDGVTQIQTEVQAKIEEIKGMSIELPVKATEALGKLTASLAGGI